FCSLSLYSGRGLGRGCISSRHRKMHPLPCPLPEYSNVSHLRRQSVLLPKVQIQMIQGDLAEHPQSHAMQSTHVIRQRRQAKWEVGHVSQRLLHPDAMPSVCFERCFTFLQLLNGQQPVRMLGMMSQSRPRLFTCGNQASVLFREA